MGGTATPAGYFAAVFRIHGSEPTAASASAVLLFTLFLGAVFRALVFVLLLTSAVSFRARSFMGGTATPAGYFAALFRIHGSEPTAASASAVLLFTLFLGAVFRALVFVLLLTSAVSFRARSFMGGTATPAGYFAAVFRIHGSEPTAASASAVLLFTLFLGAVLLGLVVILLLTTAGSSRGRAALLEALV